MKTLECKKVEIVFDGIVVIDLKRRITLKELKTYEKITGSIDFSSWIPITLPKLIEAGTIHVKHQEVNLPKLKRTERIDVRTYSNLSVPKLISCETLQIYSYVDLSSLKTCENLQILLDGTTDSGKTFNLKNLLTCRKLRLAGCTTNLDKIKSLYELETDTQTVLNAPKLVYVNFMRLFEDTTLKNLKACSSLDIHYDVKFYAPNLELVGRTRFYSSSKFVSPKLKFVGLVDGKHKAHERLKNRVSYGGTFKEFKKYVWADGILSAYETKETKFGITIYKGVYECMVKDSKFCSHGQNYTEALKSLKCKRKYAIEREKNNQLRLEKEVLPGLKVKDIKPETEFTLEEAVIVYRALTGACEHGCKSFIDTLKEEIRSKEKFTYAEMKELTTGWYGHRNLV